MEKLTAFTIKYNFENKKQLQNFYIEKARIKVHEQLINLRMRRGLTKTKLAKKYGVSISTIDLLESPEYGGWTFKILARAAKVLDARLDITLTPLENIKNYSIKKKKIL